MHLRSFLAPHLTFDSGCVSYVITPLEGVQGAIEGTEIVLKYSTGCYSTPNLQSTMSFD